MSSSSFDVGDGLRLRGQSFKVVGAAKRTLILANVKTGEFETRRRAELVAAYDKGDLVFEDLLAPPCTGPESDVQIEKSLADFTECQRDTARLKLHFLQRICPTGQVLVSRQELRGALREGFAALPDGLRTKVHVGRPPCVASFYAWRKAWINSGYQVRSLVSRFDLRGRRPNETPAELLPFIEQAITEKYETANRPTFKEAVDHAAGLVERHNLLVSPVEALPRPTRREVLRELHRRDRYVMLERRHGRAYAQAATQIFRKKAEPERLLDRVEVDHTPLDLIALTSENGLPARPYLTVLIDVASRMILGFWISFRTPNAMVVLRALKESILPKDAILRDYKIKQEYPACGVPRELFLDNGREFHSPDVEAAALDLGIKLVYCPKRQPRFKGVVERWLKEINYSFAHLLPGTTFDRYFKRGEVDSIRDAVIPIDDLRRLIWKWIVTVYARKFHRGIQTCPLERWNELLSRGKPVLPKRADVLKVILLPMEQRTLSSAGIEINTQHYACGALDELKRRPEKFELTVRPDLDDIGHIWVLHPESDTYFEAFSTMPKYANGLTVEQDEWIRSLARQRYAALPHERALLLAKQDLHDEVRSMVVAKTASPAVPASKSGKAPRPPRARSEKHAQAIAEVATQMQQEAPEAAAPPVASPELKGEVPYIDFGALKAFPTDQPSLF